MKLRYAADIRTVIWTVAMIALAAVLYARPALLPWLCPLSFYLAVSASVIAHNHNHCPTFKSRTANSIFAGIISVFYGYPTFAWVPTHNLNHHKFVNRAGDATITWRYTNRNIWLVASTYFFVSSYFQRVPINAYIRKARESNRPLYRRIVGQYVTWAGAHIAMFTLGCLLYGFWPGAKLWALSLGLPAFFALWTVMLFNYEQHVHTDPWSPHNHSRSFVGGPINFFLFNNGFHGAHHENPGAHWSLLPALHAKVADEIHPALKQQNFWLYFFKAYTLGCIMPSFRTQQIGRAPFDPPQGQERSIATADVDAVDDGVNAVMA